MLAIEVQPGDRHQLRLVPRRSIGKRAFPGRRDKVNLVSRNYPLQGILAAQRRIGIAVIRFVVRGDPAYRQFSDENVDGGRSHVLHRDGVVLFIVPGEFQPGDRHQLRLNPRVGIGKCAFPLGTRSV